MIGRLSRLVGLVVVGADDRREQEEGQPRGQEDVADRGDVLDDRQGDREDVGQRSGVQEEPRREVRIEEDVERRRVARLESGGIQARQPDRHVARVGHDRDRVQEDPDERQAQAGLAAVHPERGKEQPEGEGEERQPQGVDQTDPADEQVLRREPEDHREQEDRDPAQPDEGEVAERAAPQQAEREAEEDAED